MIQPAYIQTMARYNLWENKQMSACLHELDAEELCRDRSAFFRSLQGTANHILWGDQIWMSRFDGGAPPAGGIPDSWESYADLAQWQTARDDMDARIVDWSDGVDDTALKGDLTWYSGAAGKEVSRPVAFCIVQLFNHQTHHRGQIHQMLTEAGCTPPVSDLVFMPEDI